MKIFIVNGKSGAGKTTFEHLVAEHGGTNNIVIYSTITPVKIIANSFGWDGTKTSKDRKMLSDLKDLLTEWNDIPYKRVCEVIEHSKIHNKEAIFIDCREPEEIARFVKDFGATTIYVDRKDHVGETNNHADANVENYNYDIVIYNDDGLAELFNKAKDFYEREIKG